VIDGRAVAVMGVTVVDGLIAEMDIVTNPDHLQRRSWPSGRR